MSVLTLAAVMLISFMPLGDASAFLRPHDVESEEATRERVARALLAELAKGDDSTKLRQLEEELRPFFAALPKDMHGKLEPSTLRYALHRYFAQWRGWHMKGLEHSTSQLNTTAAEVLEVFGQGQAADLARFALLVSKLTDLVHQEAETTLRNIDLAYGIPAAELSSKKDAGIALQRYLVMYILGDSTEGVSRSDLANAERDVVDMYPAWRAAKMWSKDLDQTLQLTERARRNPFFGNQVPFKDRLGTVQELGHRFASFQNFECRSLKAAMTDIEYEGTGRVLLSDFYRVGLTGDWQFNEKADYLRSLGALDEHDPQRPSVFIPNYLLSPTNCLSPSGFYSVCCFNECEGLMGHLESQIMAPSALPSQIADLVLNLESDSIAAPRNISSALQARLGAIAKLHGGEVPLHGRLFAQWMHHAYPRECPFPHVSGSTRPLSQEEWQRTSGEDPVATKEEMTWLSTTVPPSVERFASLPWTDVEELVAPSQPRPSSFSPLRWAVILAALASTAFPLIHATKMPTTTKSDVTVQRYLV